MTRGIVATASTRLSNSRAEWLLVASVLILYLVARILLIPARAEFTHAFTHDSAYLATTAGNVLSGKGYVNDALWLVFMMPDTLPMPYHNANPLFPALAAAIAFAGRHDIFHSGFVVAAVGSAILLLALVSLTRQYVPDLRRALVLSFAVVLFPPVLVESFRYLTDGLWAALMVAFAALMMRPDPHSSARNVAAGVVLGLAWLTRGVTVIAAPAMIVLLYGRFRPAHATRRLAEIAVGAALIASPWLIHTKAVWGSYLRSDSEYSIVQDLVARRLERPSIAPDKKHKDAVARFRHSPQPPPRLAALVLESPTAFARYLVSGMGKVIKRTLGWWSLHSLPVALLMGVAAVVWCVGRRRLLTPESAALIGFAITTLLVLSLLSDTFEERYASVLTICFAWFAALGSWRMWTAAQRPAQRIALASALVLVWGILIPIHSVAAYRQMYVEDASLVAYRAGASEVDRRFANGTPVIVGLTPYFYSVETRSISLSFPDSSDDFLFRYMDKYGARFIYLTADELEYWRPDWHSTSRLPDGLRAAGAVSDGYVFRREPVTARQERIHSDVDFAAHVTR